MTAAVVLVLAWFVLQTLIAPTLRFFNAPGGPLSGLKVALGPRDNQPDLPVYGERAAKALANMHEALPVFLTLAVLNITNQSDSGPALTAAWVFLGARILYVPAYVVGIPGLRSAIWAVGFASLCAMVVPLFTERTIVRESMVDGSAPDGSPGQIVENQP
jgi:uncharacterized MAPEG superfamily protein